MSISAYIFADISADISVKTLDQNEHILLSHFWIWMFWCFEVVSTNCSSYSHKFILLLWQRHCLLKSIWSTKIWCFSLFNVLMSSFVVISLIKQYSKIIIFFWICSRTKCHWKSICLIRKWNLKSLTRTIAFWLSILIVTKMINNSNSTINSLRNWFIQMIFFEICVCVMYSILHDENVTHVWNFDCQLKTFSYNENM